MEFDDAGSQVAITVDYARQLMRYSHNSKDASPVFWLPLNEFYSKEALKLMGEALKSNTRIEELQVFLRNGMVPFDCLSDILHFVSNNPSLQILQITGDSGEGNSCEVCQSFLNAAGQNKSIKKVVVVSAVDDDGNKASLPSDLACLESCREVVLDVFTEQIGETWPIKHTIKTLRLLEQTSGTPKYLCPALKTLEQHSSSKGIKRLELAGWSPHFSSFLSSPNSAIQVLSLRDVDFGHFADSGCSAMDGLLWGLAGSQTTFKLYLGNCHFDTLAIRKLLDALKYDRLAIKDLIIEEHLEDFRGEDILELFSFSCLQTLGLVDWCTGSMDSKTEFMTDGLQICSLSHLKIGGTGTNTLTSLQPSLTNALRFQSLTSLFLSICEFSEADKTCLVDMIQDESCHLESLTLESIVRSTDDGGTVESIVIRHLNNNTRLKELVVKINSKTGTSRVYGAITDSLENLKLLTLKVFSSAAEYSFNEHSAQIGEIAKAMKQNWSLTKVLLAGNVCCQVEVEEDCLNPICTPSQKEQISALTRRNQIKKLIFSPSLASMTKDDCIQTLASLWDLPDWLTLSLWLLEEVPHHFF